MKILFLIKKLGIHTGLAFKLIVSIFSGIALIFVIIFLYNYNISKQIVEKNLKMNAENITKNGLAQIEKILYSIQKIPDNYSKIIEDTDYSKEVLVKILKQEVEMNPEIYGAALAFEPGFFDKNEKYFMPYYYRNKGQLDLIYLGDSQYDYFTMDWYQIPKELGRPLWSEPYFDEGAGNIIMSTYSVPLFRNVEGQKQFIGILTADVSMDWLSSLVNSIKVLETGYGFLISQNGTIVAHPIKEMVMNETIFSIAEAQGSDQLRQIGRNMISGMTSFAEIEYFNVKTSKLSWIAYSPVLVNGWSLGIVFPVDEYMADVHSLSFGIFIMAFIGLTIILVVIIVISRSITSPLRSLSNASIKIAQGNFDVALPEIKTKDEMKELRNSFDYMQKELSQYIINLRETTSARERIESELRIAREIQMGMIPHIFPPFPNLSQIDLFALLKPAKEVGGDLYDFFMIDDNHLCFAIGDVSGKGVPASLFMAVTRTLLRSVSDKQGSPASFVNAINKALSINNDSSMFVTMFVGVLNLNTGELLYSNAGHNPPFLITKNGSVKMFELAKSAPVGLFESIEYHESKTTLYEGEKLFMYTDGVTEAENVDSKLYSPERLMNMLQKNITASHVDLIKMIDDDVAKHVDNHTQSDDITMMTIVFYGQNN